MPIPEHWIEHRRNDRELLGWIVPHGEDFVSVDLLGRTSPPCDWLGIEEYFEETGIGYLAYPYIYQPEGEPEVQVRILEVSPEGITVKVDDFGDITSQLQVYRLRWPVENQLRPAH
ncbi:MAG: hypothetical protein ACTIJJ_04565 [Galactobacter sp.]